MKSRLQNIVVVGKSDLSTHILQNLAHASPANLQLYNGLPQKCNGSGSHTHSHKNEHDVDSAFNLTLLTRAHQSPPNIDGLNHQVVDFQLPALIEALQNQDVVIATVAPADIPFQKALIDAAIAAHVAHFIPCEFSYDTRDERIRNAFPPCAARWEVLEYLKRRSKQEGLGWTALATGCHLDKGLIEGLLGFDLTWRSATIYGSGNELFPCSTLKWIGSALVKLLGYLEHGRVRNEYLYRSEFVTSQNDILASLQEANELEWNVSGAGADECVQEGTRRMEKGFFDGAMMLFERQVLFGQVGEMNPWMDELPAVDPGRLEKAVHAILENSGEGRPDCGCG